MDAALLPLPVHPSIMIINKILANPPCRRPNSPASTPSKRNQYFSPANESTHQKIISNSYKFSSVRVFVFVLFKCGAFWFSLPVLVGGCGSVSISVCPAAAPGGVSPVSLCRLQLSPTVASRHRSILEPAASRSPIAARCWSLCSRHLFTVLPFIVNKSSECLPSLWTICLDKEFVLLFFFLV